MAKSALLPPVLIRKWSCLMVRKTIQVSSESAAVKNDPGHIPHKNIKTSDK